MTQAPSTETWEDHDEDEDEEMPRLSVSRRQVLGTLAVIAVLVVAVVLLAAHLDGVRTTLHRMDDGDPWWLGLGLVFSALSFGGYVLMFKGVYQPPEDDHGYARRIGLAESYQITMAGLAATRLLAAGGAGGLALTAWALRRAGMPRRVVADRTIAFIVLTYAVYLLAIIGGGLGLWFGVFSGPAPVAMTLVPAGISVGLLALAALTILVPDDVERRFGRWADGGGRVARVAARLATVPATISEGVTEALLHVRRRDPALLGAVAYWGFNIMILWACFHAFGQAPPGGVIVVAYFVGLLGNLLPLPGGIGGVDGGMIGAFAVFEVSGSLAVVAVLAYRVLAFWLPTLPGAVAYFQLRRTVARWTQERADQRAGELLYKVK